jgi:uncharacterized protein RhaS with RHS repeats
MYDPRPARFISEDPIGFEGGDTNLYRYVGNSPTNFVDPFGLCATDNFDFLDGIQQIRTGLALGDADEILIASDVRWPGNASVTNETNQPVYPLISTDEADSYEVLYPGATTPDKPGRSKDTDGVWVLRGDNWFFFPIKIDSLDNRRRTVKDDGVYDLKGKQIVPWDPRYPNKNTSQAPETRGRWESRTPPDPNKQYLNGADYIEVKGGKDTNSIINNLQNGLERTIRGIFK